MFAQDLARTQLTDGISAQRLLEGLARLYQLVLVVNGDGRIVWLSDEMGALCGNSECHIGKDARRIFPESQDAQHRFAIHFQLRRQGYLSNMQMEVNCADGTTIPVEVSILPISMDDERDSLFVAIARPVEEWKQKREDPAHERGTPSAILESSPDAVVAVNERGFVIYANPAVERLVGLAPGRLTNQPIALLLSNATDIERLVSSLEPGEGVGNQDLTLQRADGSTVRVSASASALRRENGERRGTVLFLRDVTEQRGIERTLERKNAELEHCVHSLAHDLRSPLVSLLGFSRLLRQDYAEILDDTGLHFIDRIEQAGRTMEDLIHDLLELSRIGRAGERRTHVEPRGVLLQIAAEMKPRLETAGIRLVIPDDPPLIYCDRTRLYQVLTNLVGNAIDHMGPCRNPEISVEIWNDRLLHNITVRDRGRGISAENQKRVFDVFQSLGPTCDGHRGSGIGLAIVKKIAETHGGWVRLESEPGRGATFHVTFSRR